MKRIMYLFVAMLSILASSMLVYAGDLSVTPDAPITSEGSSQDIPVTLTADPMQFSVTLPSSLPITVDSTGKVYTASNAEIVNYSSRPVRVTDVIMESADGWTLIGYDNCVPSSGSVALDIEGVKSTGNNINDFTLASYDPIGPDGDALHLDYTALLPTFYEELVLYPVNVTFVINWADVASEIRTYPDLEYSSGVYYVHYNQLVNFVVDDTSKGKFYSSDPGVIAFDDSTYNYIGYTKGEGKTTITYKSPTKTVSVDVVVKFDGEEPTLQYYRKIPTSDFHGYKSQITEIYFVDYEEVPSELYAGPWDVSANQNGSVMAWMPTSTTAVISGNGSGYIKANSMMFSWFESFTKAHTINGLDLLDTSDMVSAWCLFDNCEAVINLDIADWDTSNLFYSYAMFADCYALRDLDTSKWQLPQLRNMTYMFDDLYWQSEIKLPGLTSFYLTNAYMAFYRSPGIATIDLSRMDPSHLVAAQSMFEKSTSLRTVYVKDAATASILKSKITNTPAAVKFVPKN